MKKLFLTAAVTALLTACGTTPIDFKTTKNTSGFGNGNTVTLETVNVFNLVGNEVKVGDLFPSMILKDETLKDFDTSNKNEKVRIYNVLASVDTPVCVQQTKDLSQFIADNKTDLEGIEMFAISADTPFAQMRFRKEAELENNFVFLSDSINHEFGKKTGSQIKELGLLARSIIVVDKNNTIVHIQRVPELTTIPDLKEAISIAKTKV